MVVSPFAHRGVINRHVVHPEERKYESVARSGDSTAAISNRLGGSRVQHVGETFSQLLRSNVGVGVVVN